MPVLESTALFLALRILKRVVMAFLVVSVGLVLLYKFIPVPVTLTMIGRMADSETPSLQRKWVPLEKISLNLRKAVICSEDQLFLLHSGFDFQSIDQALAERRSGQRHRGASTLSQQVAKNVFLWQGGGWMRKGLEAYFTLLIELFWSKERILEVYLNVAEMGNGIFGAEAASQAYFHKPASALTRLEAARIAVCLPNPRQMNAGRPSAYVSQRAAFIAGAIDQMPEEYYADVVN